LTKPQSLYNPFTIYHNMRKIRFGISMDREAVGMLDEAVRRGRFANRSQAIEYCVKQVLAMEEHEARSLELLLDFLDLIERHPRIKEQFRGFIEQEMGR